jgi:tellurite resistance protein
MTNTDPRPKRYPPPEFPPRRKPPFVRMPPAVFPPVLGLLGLAAALRDGLRTLELPTAAAQLLAGLTVALWAFAAVAYLAKLAQRRSVVVDDLRVLPGRAGLAAGTAGGMLAAGLIAPHAPGLAVGLLFASLAAHLVLAVLLIRLLASLPAIAREVNPTWHLSFVGFIVAAPGAVALGLPLLATVLFWATLPVAAAIWLLSLRQAFRTVPPAPLRPLLAIHLAPACLLATVAGVMGWTLLAEAGLVLACGIVVALLAAGSWIIASGPSALWGAFTFPLAALCVAMLGAGSGWREAGLVLLIINLAVIPALAWSVLRAWPGGRLAERSNAAGA